MLVIKKNIQVIRNGESVLIPDIKPYDVIYKLKFTGQYCKIICI